MKKFKKSLLSLILAIVLLCAVSAPASAFFCRSNYVTSQMLAEIYAYIRKYGLSDDLPQSAKSTPLPAEQTPAEVPAAKTPAEIPAEKSEEKAPSADHSASDFEKSVVTLVNRERAAYGLPALALDEELCAKARIKSQDMATNRYFSHTSPTYGSPFDMMRSLGITYRSAGENIASGYASPESVVKAWMASEGHRANILSASYTRLGVGYVASGNYWTQWFIG